VDHHIFGDGMILVELLRRAGLGIFLDIYFELRIRQKHLQHHDSAKSCTGN